MANHSSSLIWILLAALFVSFPAFAEAQQKNESVQKLQIGVSISIPPWVIKENDSGIELDLLFMAFEDFPYEIELIYAPFARVHALFDAGQIDGYINAKENPDKKGYLSQTVATFQNVAISLKSKQFPDNLTIDFLADKQVVAFQKASQLLGPEFYAMSERNPSYQEVAKQILQINVLFARNVDFIVMDKSIFGYYWNQAAQRKDEMAGQYNYHKPVTFHELFSPSHYAYRFMDKAVRDDFDQGLTRLKENGRYAKVFDRYDHLKFLYKVEGQEK